MSQSIRFPKTVFFIIVGFCEGIVKYEMIARQDLKNLLSRQPGSVKKWEAYKRESRVVWETYNTLRDSCMLNKQAPTKNNTFGWTKKASVLYSLWVALGSSELVA